MDVHDRRHLSWTAIREYQSRNQRIYSPSHRAYPDLQRLPVLLVEEKDVDVWRDVLVFVPVIVPALLLFGLLCHVPVEAVVVVVVERDDAVRDILQYLIRCLGHLEVNLRQTPFWTSC